MNAILGDWIGRSVSVTLNVGGITGAVKLVGTLLQFDTTGALFEMPKSQTYIPFAAILHVTLADS